MHTLLALRPTSTRHRHRLVLDRARPVPLGRLAAPVQPGGARAQQQGFVGMVLSMFTGPIHVGAAFSALCSRSLQYVVTAKGALASRDSWTTFQTFSCSLFRDRPRRTCRKCLRRTQLLGLTVLGGPRGGGGRDAGAQCRPLESSRWHSPQSRFGRSSWRRAPRARKSSSTEPGTSPQCRPRPAGVPRNAAALGEYSFLQRDDTVRLLQLRRARPLQGGRQEPAALMFPRTGRRDPIRRDLLDSIAKRQCFRL